MKFTDAMHAYFNNIRDDIPTATGAHDTFWDYVANNPEGLHQVLWIMSDYGIVRSYRMMSAWSINTYLFVNKEGVATRSEEHTSELQSRGHLVCRLLLEKKKKTIYS